MATFAAKPRPPARRPSALLPGQAGKCYLAAVILGGPRRAPHSSPQVRREITATASSHPAISSLSHPSVTSDVNRSLSAAHHLQKPLQGMSLAPKRSNRSLGAAYHLQRHLQGTQPAPKCPNRSLGAAYHRLRHVYGHPMEPTIISICI